MRKPAIVYLLVGLPGAGKTTKARQLEIEINGSVLPEPPHGYTSWSAWAANRWPSFPDEYA